VGVRSHADRVKDLADVRKMALFQWFHHALQTLTMGDTY